MTMKTRYLHYVTSMMFFILLFEEKEAKSWKEYNLTVGPLEHESGRYVFKESSTGGRLHCRYCEMKALKDSTYAFLQQPMCIKKYDGKNIKDEVLQEEKEKLKYPLCRSGDVPGCGPPPGVKKTKDHVWQCDPGCSLVNYSVYYSCALVCEITNKVEWSYYCNETLQWHAERSSPWQACEAPVTVTPETPWNVIVAASVGGLLLIIVGVFACVCWQYQRRKRARSNENINGPGEDQPLAEVDNEGARNGIRRGGHDQLEQETEIVDEGIPDASIATLGSNESSVTVSVGTGTSIEHAPLLPPAGSRTREMASSTENDHILYEDTDGKGLFGAEGGQLPPNFPNQNKVPSDAKNSFCQPEVKPSISIILTEDGKKKQSIPLQGDLHSISKGSDFAIVPNSPGGLTVKRFIIERKDDGRPFRGEKLNFWYTVQKASEDDAGLYGWKMTLENNVEHAGSFEIGISMPPLPRRFDDERVPPIGQEDDNHIPSVRNVGNPHPVLPQGPPSAPPLKIDSLLSRGIKNNNIINNNNNSVIVNRLQQQQCRPENISGKVHSINQNPPTLNNSSLFGSDQHVPVHSVDSGLMSGHRPSSRGRASSHGSGNQAPSRMNGQNCSDNVGIRPEDLRSGTSGYESQNSTEIARQRFNEHFNGVPGLNIASFESRNILKTPADIHREREEEDLSDIQELIHREVEESSRPDPAGGTSLEHHTEMHVDVNPEDQTFRKYVNTGTHQQEPRVDEDVDTDTDSLSDRLDSVALTKIHIQEDVLPNIDDHIDENAIETNGDTNPRGETEELKEDKHVENRVADSPDSENHMADTPDSENRVADNSSSENRVADTPDSENRVADTPDSENRVADTPDSENDSGS